MCSPSYSENVGDFTNSAHQTVVVVNVMWKGKEMDGVFKVIIFVRHADPLVKQ